MTNTVAVEYIEGQYLEKQDEGFKRRKWEWDPLNFGPLKRDGQGGDDGDGDGAGKTRRLTDDEIKELM